MIGLIAAGIFNIFLIPFGFYRCWVLNDRFSFKEIPLSYATKTHTKLLFSFYIAAIALVQIVFLFLLFYQLEVTSNLLTILPLTSMAGLLISGVVHSDRSKLIHRSAIIYMVCSLIFWSFLWHAHIYSVDQTLGILGFTISGLVLAGCPLLQLYYKNFGMSELLFAAATVCWNALMIGVVLSL